MDAHEAPAVLFLLSSLRVGGSETKTVRLANTLAERNFDVTVAYLDPPASLADAIGPRVTEVFLHRRGKISVRALRLLIRTIRERSIRTVVSVNLYPALYAQLARLLIGRTQLRFLAAVNTTDIRTWKLALQMSLYQPVLRAADLVIFGAEAQRQLWQRKYGIGKPGRTRVIYNGVDTDRFAPLAEPAERLERRPARGFVLGTVGQMRPEKAHLDLIRAVAALRARGLDVGAILVGDGAERSRIEAEIARLDLRAHVVLAGEARDVRLFLSSMDLFVLTSVEIETFSNAALEAMAAGIPVVSSDVGGMREAFAFGGGRLYPRGDVAALARCIEPLLRDPSERSALSAAARQAAVEHFSWSRMVQEFTEMLQTPRPGAGTNFAPVPLDVP